jgi:hypothetical protein
VPASSYIETIDIGDHTNPPTYAPSTAAIRMETWLNVVHGIKSIGWFNISFNGSGTFPETYAFMQEFTDQSAALAPVILGPVSAHTVTDNANTQGNRVDQTVREDSLGNIWIFATRLTEVPETTAAPINVTFTVDGLDNTRQVVRPAVCQQTVVEQKGDPAGSHRTYSFTLGQAPIRPGTVQVAGHYSQGWITLSDNGSGTLRGFVYSWKNRNLGGTVNYATGAITVDFGEVSLTTWVDAPIDSGLTSV